MQPLTVEISGAAPGPISAETAWNEALFRVEAYLRAHHLERPALLNQLVGDIIREARERALVNQGEAPVALALNATRARIGAWFARAGSPGDWASERVRARDRFALVLADMSVSGHPGFLANGPMPPELAAALATGVFQPGPELRFSNMAPELIEFGFDDPNDPNSPRQSGWLMLRAAAGWLAIFGLFGVTWAAAH